MYPEYASVLGDAIFESILINLNLTFASELELLAELGSRKSAGPCSLGPLRALAVRKGLAARGGLLAGAAYGL